LYIPKSTNAIPGLSEHLRSGQSPLIVSELPCVHVRCIAVENKHIGQRPEGHMLACQMFRTFSPHLLHSSRLVAMVSSKGLLNVKHANSSCCAARIDCTLSIHSRSEDSIAGSVGSMGRVASCSRLEALRVQRVCWCVTPTQASSQYGVTHTLFPRNVGGYARH
jgi:hypothetical protein